MENTFPQMLAHDISWTVSKFQGLPDHLIHNDLKGRTGLVLYLGVTWDLNATLLNESSLGYYNLDYLPLMMWLSWKRSE